MLRAKQLLPIMGLLIATMIAPFARTTAAFAAPTTSTTTNQGTTVWSPGDAHKSSENTCTSAVNANDKTAPHGNVPASKTNNKRSNQHTHTASGADSQSGQNSTSAARTVANSHSIQHATATDSSSTKASTANSTHATARTSANTSTMPSGGTDKPATHILSTPLPASPSGTNDYSTEDSTDAFPLRNHLYYTKREIDTMPESELRLHPMLYWRHWANQPHPIGWVCACMFIVTSVLTECFPGVISITTDCCRRQFWKSLLRGICISTLVLLIARVCIVTEIGMPLADLLIGANQLAFLFGLAAASNLIAEAVFRRLNLRDKLSARPRLYRFILYLTGTFILGVIAAIPGVGAMPPIGIRLVSLIALLGLGGAIKTRFGARPL
jgi:hypothetical protein